MIIYFLINFASERLSAYADRDSGSLTASSVAAIVALVASVPRTTNNHSGASLASYGLNTTSFASPSLDLFTPFLTFDSHHDDHYFLATLTTTGTTFYEPSIRYRFCYHLPNIVFHTPTS